MDEQNFTNQQMRKVAKLAKREFQDNIQDIKRNLDAKRLFAKFTAQRKQLTEQRAEFRVTSEGSQLPDPKKAIQAYFNSDETKAVYSQLEEDSTTKKILTPKQAQTIQAVPKEALLQDGHQDPSVWGPFHQTKILGCCQC